MQQVVHWTCILSVCSANPYISLYPLLGLQIVQIIEWEGLHSFFLFFPTLDSSTPKLITISLTTISYHGVLLIYIYVFGLRKAFTNNINEQSSNSNRNLKIINYNISFCYNYTHRICNIWLHIWSILEVKNALSGIRLIPDGGGIESTITKSNNSVKSKAITNTLWIWNLMLCGIFELATSSKYLLMLSIMVLRVCRAPYLDSPSWVTAAEESERTVWLFSEIFSLKK